MEPTYNVGSIRPFYVVDESTLKKVLCRQILAANLVIPLAKSTWLTPPSW